MAKDIRIIPSSGLITLSGSAHNTTLTVDDSGSLAFFREGVTDGPALFEVSGSDTTINDLTVGRGSGDISSNTTLGCAALASNTTGDCNVAIGQSALNANTTGRRNVAIGNSALAVNTSGRYNVAVGPSALNLNTIGTANTGTGFCALRSNTTGDNNSAFGDQSLRNNTTGNKNSALGRRALYSVTSGNLNAALGYGALRCNTAGYNTAVGGCALAGNTTGINNVGVGYAALCRNTTGICNVAVGHCSLFENTTGICNVAVGNNALQANTAGYNNTAMGTDALCSNTTGAANIAIGRRALLYNSIGTNNVAVGNSALQDNTTGSENTAVGVTSLANVTTGARNTGLGSRAGQELTTANNNTFVGRNAALYTTTGGNNVAMGLNALFTNTVGSENVGIGVYALRNTTTGSNNVAMGRDASKENTGANNNVAIGRSALCKNTASANTALGTCALRDNTTGNKNTAVGLEAARANTTGIQGTALGYRALWTNTTGNNNVAIGTYALKSNTTGVSNTAVGTCSMTSNTGARNVAIGTLTLCSNKCDGNTAVGYHALRFSTTGIDNVAVGYCAMRANTTGKMNTAMGSCSMQSNTTSIDNAAFGYRTLGANTTGNCNVALGSRAMEANTIGVQNVAIGKNALRLNTTGNCNIAVGATALGANTIGHSNVAVGRAALTSNTTGNRSTALGYGALFSNTTGNNNTALGNQALKLNTIGTQNTAVGYNALFANTTGNHNTAIGMKALYCTTKGGVNTAIGRYTLRANTEGNSNVGIGSQALCKNTTGNCNTAIGTAAMFNNVSGSNNVAIGACALRDSDGDSNTAVGHFAGLSNNGNNTIAIGWKTLYVNDSNYMTAVGHAALRCNTTGANSTAVGCYALNQNTIGSNNTALGSSALRCNTTGNWNTAIGTAAMFCNTTGKENVAIGACALRDNSNTQNVAVGSFASLANTAVNTVAIGWKSLYVNESNGAVAIGSGALRANTTGAGNTAVGCYSARFTTTGTYTTAIGFRALCSNTTGGENTALGGSALRNNTTGASNTALGVKALCSNTTGQKNTAVGCGALLSNTTGVDNTANGLLALQDNTTGGQNTAHGSWALRNNTTGCYNTALGRQALQRNTVGSNNTAIGWLSLCCNTGSGNVAIGRLALRCKTSGNNNTAIGPNAGSVLTTGASNVFIGGTQGTGFEAQDCNIFISDGVGNIRIFVTGSTGNVGIGTTNPSALLHLSGGANFRTLQLEHNNPGIYFKDEGYTPGYHIGYNADELYILRDSDGNGDYNNILASWTGDRYRVWGDQQIDGDLTVNGIVTAQEFHTEFVSASIVYQSGSTKFGDTADDLHSFTGSLSVLYPSTYGAKIDLRTSAHKWTFEGGETGYSANSLALDYDGSTFIRMLGTSDVRIGSSVSIGTIGTAAPEKLYVAGNMRMYNNTTASIDLRHSSGYQGSIIRSVRDTGPDAQDFGSSMLQFLTNDNSTTSASLAMSISSEKNSIFYGDITLDKTSPKVYFNDAQDHYIGYNNSTRLLFGLSGSNSIIFNRVGDTHAAIWMDQYTANYGYPAYTFQDDTNTGLTSLSEDTLALVGGGSARLFVASGSGNIGIGTTSPSFKLDVSSGNSSNAFGLSLSGTERLKMYADGSNNYFEAKSGQNFRFSTTGGAIFNISNGGNVGIGTTAPNVKLEVKGASAENTQLRLQTAGGASEEPTIILRRNSSAYGEVKYVPDGGGSQGIHITDYRKDASNIIFKTSGSVERMRINTDGDVGIGTTSPGAKLEVVGTDQMTFFKSTTSGLYNKYSINSSSTIGYIGAGGSIFTGANSNDFGVRAENSLYFGAGGNSISMMIDTSDNVGIGTTSPLTALHVEGTANNNLFKALTLRNNSPSGDIGTVTETALDFIHTDNNTTVTSYPRVRISAKQGTSAADGYPAEAGGDLLFSTALGTAQNTGTLYERMRITDGGNVGIGTTSPDYKLHIANNGAATINLSKTDDDQWLRLTGGNGGTQKIAARYNLEISSNPNVGSDSDMIFKTQGSTRMFISGSGNVGIGTTAPGYELDIQSAGDANLNLRSTSTGNGVLYLRGPNKWFGVYAGTSTSLNFRDETAGVTRMVIDNTGQVGIGTTSPDRTLTVSGDIGATSKVYTNVIRDNAGGIVSLQDNGGNVGIGTTSPGNKLTVAGNIEASGSALVATNNDADSVGLSLVSPGSGVNVTFDFEVGDSGISNIHPKNLVIRGSSAASDIVFSPSTSYPGMMVLDGSTGRVGIGVTSPLAKLDIDGGSSKPLKLTTTNNDAIEFRGASATPFTFIGYNSRGFRFWDSSNSELFRIASDGDITLPKYGQGNITGTAAYTLAVDSSGNIIETTGGGSGNIDGTGTADYLTKWTDSNTITTSSFYEASTGNIGLGTTTPGSYKLNISGNANVSGEVRATYGKFQEIKNRVNGNSAISFNSASDILFYSASAEVARFESGKLGIGTSSPQVELHVEGRTRMTYDGNTAFYAGNYVRVFNSQAYQFRNSGGSSIAQINLDGNSYFNGGNVGIGTTAPDASLHVASTTNDYVAKFSHTTATGYAPGSILLQAGQSNSRGQGLFHYNTEADEVWFTGVPYAVDSKKWIVANKYNTAVDVSVAQLSHALLTIDSDNGNVGIGTSSPAQKLHVNGAGRFQGALEVNHGVSTADAAINLGVARTDSGYAYLDLIGDTTYTDYGLRVIRGNAGANASSQINHRGTGDFELRALEAANITFDTAATERMRITSAGNVGIGTTSPGNPLHVSKDAGGNAIAYFQSLNSNGYGVAVRTADTGNDKYVLRLDSNSGSTPVMYASNAGNVGIGTTNPGGRLDVQQSSTGNLLARVWNTNGSGTGSTSIRIANSGNNNDGARLEFTDNNYFVATISGDRTQGMVFRTSATGASPTGIDEQMRITTDGKVGIGTTSPGKLLTVNGESQFIGESFFNAGFDVTAGTGTRFRNDIPLNFGSSRIFEIVYDSTADKLEFNSGSDAIMTLDGDGNLVVEGSITAQEFHTEFVSASIVYQSGSTKFGNTVDDDHNFTGSLNVLAQSGASGIDIKRGSNIWMNLNNSSTRNEINFESPSGLRFYRGSDSTSPLFISASGNVGINTVTPKRKLHVVGDFAVNTGGGQYYGVLVNGGESADPKITIGDWHNSSGYITWDSSANHLVIDSQHSSAASAIVFTGNDSATEYMRISSAGNVGIGTNNPAEKLEVYNGDIKLNDGSRNLIIGEEGGSSYQIKSSGYLVIDATSGIQLNKTTSGNVTVQGGNLGVGTSSPLFKFAAVSPETTGVNRVVGIFAKSGTSHGSTILRVGRTQLTSTTISDDVQVVDIEHNSGGSGPFRYGTYADGVISNGSSATNGPYGALHFATSGSVRMTVGGGTLAGNVGIGTTSPNALLQIDTPATNQAGQGLRLSRPVAGTHYHSVEFATGTSVDWSVGQNSNDAFEVYENGLASTTRFTIKEGGNVGIGRTNPGAKLDVAGTIRTLNSSANPTINLSDNNDSNWDLELERDTNSFKINQNAGGFNTNALTISGSNGYVGIGTTLPSYKLHVASSGNAEIFAQRTSGAGMLIQSQASVGVVGTNTNHRLDLKTNGGTRMAIDTSGKVGIGTTTPSDLLHIKSTSTDARMILDGHTGADAELKFFEAGVSKFTVGYDAASTNFVIGTTNVDTNQRLVIDSSGDVGIGTTSPQLKLHVNGDARVNNLMVGNAAASNTPAADIHIKSSGTDAKLRIEDLDGDNLYYDFLVDSGSGFSLKEGSTTRLFVEDVTGNVGIGTTTPQRTLDVNGDIQNNGVLRRSGNVFLKNDGSTTKIGPANATSGDVSIHSSATLGSGDTIATFRSNGRLGLGVTSPTATLDIAEGGSGATTVLMVGNTGNGNLKARHIEGKLHNSTADGILHLNYYASEDVSIAAGGGNVQIGTGTASYKLDVDGEVGATSFIETSARRFKENIEPISGALDIVSNIDGITFNRIGEERREYGFIADDILDVAPELVSHNDNGEVQGVHYARTVAILTEAVKELDNKVKAQDLFIKDLVARIEKLENK